jgi:rRNA-processing protein FCF1
VINVNYRQQLEIANSIKRYITEACFKEFGKLEKNNKIKKINLPKFIC